jgi:thiazole synthase
MGCEAVLMNSAIANAQHPIIMAEAMKHAIVAGRLAYLAGRMPKKLYASASSPLDGLIK